MASTPRHDGRGALRLGVLDFGKGHAGDDASPAAHAHRTVQEIEALAVAADRAGYERFWLAEHHTPDAKVPRPELMLPLLASRTGRIKVGTGCTLVPYCSPFRIAENFRLLEAMFPGRVELGVSRGPGADPKTALALVHHRESELRYERYEEKVVDVITFLRGGHPYGHPYATIRAAPRGVQSPPIWHAGATDEAMVRAAYHGTNFSYAFFLAHPGRHEPGSDAVARAAERIRERYIAPFRPNPHVPAPRVSAAVTVACAPTAREAEALDAAAVAAGNAPSNVVGDPAECARLLADVGAALGATELLVAMTTSDFAAKLRALDLLAKAAAPAPVPVARAPRARRA